MNCYCDYDYPTVYRASRRVARKQYRCEECSRNIKPGEKYEYVFAVWDGSPGYMKTCGECVSMRQWVKNNVPCLCFSHGSTIDDCCQAVIEAKHRAPEETRGLIFGFWRKLIAIKKAGGHVPRNI